MLAVGTSSAPRGRADVGGRQQLVSAVPPLTLQ